MYFETSFYHIIVRLDWVVCLIQIVPLQTFPGVLVFRCHKENSFQKSYCLSCLMPQSLLPLGLLSKIPLQWLASDLLDHLKMIHRQVAFAANSYEVLMPLLPFPASLERNFALD